MDGLFSHASSQPAPDEAAGVTGAGALPARRARVLVPVPADQAFEGFTEYVHLWWPATKLSSFGSGTHLAFGGGALYEEAEDGRQYQWGRIVRAEVPREIELSFTMGLDQHPPTRVVVRFQEEGSGTAVEVVHDGWASGAAGREQYERYEAWPEILGYYARFMGGRQD